MGALTGKNLDRAEGALRKYLQQPPKPNQPSWAGAHYRLGMIHEHRGDRARARAEFEAAVRLDPKQEDARKALDRVR
jgi:Tfp pilus assembly protein PilF